MICFWGVCWYVCSVMRMIYIKDVLVSCCMGRVSSFSAILYVALHVLTIDPRADRSF
jgi:hypothetical protein